MLCVFIVELLMNKWFWLALVAIAILINLYVFGKKSVHQEMSIDASPAEVWKILTDFESIGLWNKVLIPIEGQLKEGEKVTYEFHQDSTSSSKIPALVKTLKAPELLNQTGGMRGILTFNHKYMLFTDGKGTRLIIHEEYRGIMVPFWNPKPVEKAYGRLAQSLKDRVTELKK